VCLAGLTWLTCNQFPSIEDARNKIEDWRNDDNARRPLARSGT
jgi:hypothetical protein